MNISPPCRRDEHEACAWYEVGADFSRTFWCDCDCHRAGAVIDLTASPTPERAGEERELVSQE